MTILIITINRDFFEKTINKGLTPNTTKGAYLSIMIIKKKIIIPWMGSTNNWRESDGL